MNLTKIKCSRCKAKGGVDSPVVYAGAPGTCFKCEGRGWVYKDKFAETFARQQGEFYGFSRPSFVKNSNRIVKEIARCSPSDIMTDSKTTVTKLTEEQALKFFLRYGTRTEVENRA